VQRIYVEDWVVTYGSPYLIDPDDIPPDTVRLVEDGMRLVCHPGRPAGDGTRLAFVDGVRRGDACLYQEDPATGELRSGVAGSHACGAVLVEPGAVPVIDRTRVSRLAIWGGGLIATLPDQSGGWSWTAASIGRVEPDAPLIELQQRMRRAEGVLAEMLCGSGFLAILDGPLTYVRSRDLPVVGYVKTHHRPLLDPASHRAVPSLGPGERTSLFTLGEDRYSCYLRLVAGSEAAGPWAGIVRVEIPQSAGQAAAVDVADRVAGALPRFAGVAHRDPRAPQNLQPVGALESHLRHLLGHPGLARRAVRAAVFHVGRTLEAEARSPAGTALAAAAAPVTAADPAEGSPTIPAGL
jgi:hypothetical protein